MQQSQGKKCWKNMYMLCERAPLNSKPQSEQKNIFSAFINSGRGERERLKRRMTITLTMKIFLTHELLLATSFLLPFPAPPINISAHSPQTQTQTETAKKYYSIVIQRGLRGAFASRTEMEISGDCNPSGHLRRCLPQTG